MKKIYATEFSEIPQTLAENIELRDAIINLIENEPIPGKVLEGENRLIPFKNLLKRLVRGEITLALR